MKRYRTTMILLVLLCLCSTATLAQFQALTTQQPVPPTQQFSVSSPTTVSLPAQDNDLFKAEDEAEVLAAQVAGVSVPFRSSIPVPVNYNLTNSGNWETLPDGSRVWRLRIESAGATDLCLHFNGWQLVKPCEIYYYNDSHSQVEGPFTYVDNWDGTNISPFIVGSAVTIELVVPEGADDANVLSIQSVLHGYRHMFNREEARERDVLDNFGDSGACNVNINCFGYMQEEKRAVAMVFDPSVGRWCSGTMMNNTLQNGDPIFLTADHCLNGNHTNWQFVFNYESAGCSPNTDGPTNSVISNASLLANWVNSDFAILRLSRPRPNTGYIPAFMGWDRSGTAPSSTYGIHHPSGDVKKGSEDFQAPVSADWNGNFPNTHWRTDWDNGVTEGGSSGSPLIANSGRVIGQLHGGLSGCGMPSQTDRYGKLSSSWDGGGNSSSRARDWLDPNNSGSQVGNYWQPFGPPNDSCGQPGFTTITTLPFSVSGSTQFAANNFNTLNCNTNTSPEVVYMMQLPCDHTVTVSTCGSNYDTQIMVYGVTSCMGWSYLVDCNDDFNGCGTQSQVTFTATGGTLYTIVLEGYASSWGNFVLNVSGFSSGAQGNAQCPGYEITTVPYFTYGATWCGNDDVNPECRPTQDGQDVHWYWVSPYNQAMRAKTCFINFDTILDVRYGGACPGTWSAGCNDDYFCGSDALASTVVFDASAGATYYIHMDGFNGAEGMSSLELEVWNDNCSSPWVVPSLPFNTFGDTRPARDDIATYNFPNSKDVLFQYTSPICQNMGVSLCFDTDYDSYVEVRTGGPCPGSTVVTYNDDFCGTASQATWGAEANRTYYIVVAGYQMNEGPFSIQFYNIPGAIPAPAGDVCETSIQIPALPFTDYGNSCCMADNYAPCVGVDSREMVYNYYSTTCQELTVSLCGSGYDTGLGIYGGVCPNISPLIVCNDDNYCGDTYVLQSTASFTAQANTNYQFLVHGFSTHCGNYVINVSGTPCVAATPDPVDDLVILANDGSDDAHLYWTATANAFSYEIYYSTDQNNIFAPGNHILTTTSTNATVSGILSTPEMFGYFQVVAVGADGVALAANLGDQRPKLEAINSVEIQNPYQFMNNEVEEQAPLNK